MNFTCSPRYEGVQQLPGVAAGWLKQEGPTSSNNRADIAPHQQAGATTNEQRRQQRDGQAGATAAQKGARFSKTLNHLKPIPSPARPTHTHV